MAQRDDEEVGRRMSLLMARVGVDPERPPPPPPPPARKIDLTEFERRLELLEARFGGR